MDNCLFFMDHRSVYFKWCILAYLIIFNEFIVVLIKNINFPLTMTALMMCVPVQGQDSKSLPRPVNQWENANDNNPMIQSILNGQSQLPSYIFFLFEKLLHLDMQHNKEEKTVTLCSNNSDTVLQYLFCCDWMDYYLRTLFFFFGNSIYTFYIIL